MYISGVDPTKAYDTAVHALGTRGVDHLGREFVFVEATANIALSAACLVNAGFTATEATADLAAQGTGGSKMVGVAMAALTLASTKYGWLARYGSGIPVKTAIAAVFTRMVATADSGQIDDAGTGASVVAILGIGLETAQAAAPGIKPAMLNYPFVNTEPVS